MMAAIKNFFKKKKLEIKFSKLGEGHKLCEDEKSTPRPATASSTASPADRQQVADGAQRAAAEAALARLELQKNPRPIKKIDNPSLRAQVQLEKKALEDAENLKAKFAPPQEVNLEKSSVLTRVLFWCPGLFGDTVLGSSAEVESLIRDRLYVERVDSPAESAVLMMVTLAKPADLAHRCRETLTKLLVNLCEHPDEGKFRRIRAGNPRIAEVLGLEGADDFLKLCGFERHQMPLTSSLPPASGFPPNTANVGPSSTEGDSSTLAGATEEFLVISEQRASDTGHLEVLIRLLHEAEPVLPELYRDTRIFKVTSTAASSLECVELPEEFFNWTAEEAKREQELRQRAVEEAGMLLTKAMRERIHQKELRRFRYALIRVRLPDNIVLQATFRASDSLHTVRQWLEQDCFASCATGLSEVTNDSSGHQQPNFHLISPPVLKKSGSGLGTCRPLDQWNSSLAELELAPSSVINLQWRGQLDGTNLIREDLLAKIALT